MLFLYCFFFLYFFFLLFLLFFHLFIIFFQSCYNIFHMRRVLRVIQGTLFYLFLRDLIDLSFEIQDMYTYASFVLLLFLHWMYIRNFFLDFSVFFSYLWEKQHLLPYLQSPFSAKVQYGIIGWCQGCGWGRGWGWTLELSQNFYT